ncbi:hypothetical protein ACSAZL_09775 [Methanosarcina sp. T3]|uniref:hypothetical protein n=1 Tax=Methanosarcina sp. T3 TaxID=3439062 RepID=UPI003F84E83B
MSLELIKKNKTPPYEKNGISEKTGDEFGNSSKKRKSVRIGEKNERMPVKITSHKNPRTERETRINRYERESPN